MSADELREPPHSVEAEQSVIGGLLLEPTAFDKIEFLRPAHFYDERNRLLFAAMRALYEADKPIDPLLVADALKPNNELDRVGGAAYINDLVINTPGASNIRRYAEIVRDRATLRELQANAGDIIDQAGAHGADPQGIAAQAVVRLESVIQADEVGDGVTFAALIGAAVDVRDKPQAALSTGFSNLNVMLAGGGFKAGQLIVIAGRSSMGKSALASNIAEHAAATVPVAVFSMEMTGIEIAERALRHHEEQVGINEAVRHLMSDLKMVVIDAPSLTIGNIRTRCRRIKRKNGLALIVVDYLQLMQGIGENRTQEVGSLSRGLKAIAKEFAVPVIAVAQVNRAVEQRPDKRPVMSDLRESGDIENDADIVIMVYRDEYYDPGTLHKGLAEILIRKQRNGRTGTAWMQFTDTTTRFSDFTGEVPRQNAPAATPRRAATGKAALPDFKTRAAGDV